MRADHRPWPLPDSPWLMMQSWHDLLFAHWPVDSSLLRTLIPEALHLDEFEGQAWVGVVPFTMSGIRYRFMPPIPTASRFAELNVRTYVTHGGKPGVYFFSLDAASMLAVQGARALFRLPYYYAHIDCQREGETFRYQCTRRSDHRDAGLTQFIGDYTPTSDPFLARQGTLEHWLTERYCFYTATRSVVYRCDIWHEPYQLQYADADILMNTMTNASAIHLPDTAPLLHYSKGVDVRAWGLTAAIEQED